MIRGSVHETRNALNGVMVNLEVVRSRLQRGRSAGDSANGSGEEVLSFAEQAVAQAEAASRFNEGVGALLTLISECIDADGRMRCAASANGLPGIRFEVGGATAERLVPRLQALGAAAGFGAETHGGAVIFTIPETSQAESRIQE